MLLMNALKQSWKHALQVASIGVIVEAIDDSARQFYLHHNFWPVPEQPNKLFLEMKAIEKLFE